MTYFREHMANDSLISYQNSIIMKFHYCSAVQFHKILQVLWNIVK